MKFYAELLGETRVTRHEFEARDMEEAMRLLNLAANLLDLTVTEISARKTRGQTYLKLSKSGFFGEVA